MGLDAELSLLLNGLTGRSPFFDGLIVFFASDLAYVLPFIFLVFLAFSSYSGREKLRIFLVTAASSIIARFGITELIRFFIHRPRPFSALPVRQLLTDAAWSFPSGHAVFFFAVAMSIYLYDKKWGIAFFTAALLISVSRVIAGIHYPSDIAVGALIGVVVAWGMYVLAQKKTIGEPNQTS